MRKFIVGLMMAAFVQTAGCVDQTEKGSDVDSGDTNVSGKYKVVDSVQVLSLDGVDGESSEGVIKTGSEIVFHIRLANKSGAAVVGLTSGFRVYSPDGAQWNTSVGDTTGAISSERLEQRFINEFSITGSGADTIGFAGFRMKMPGIVAGFDSVAYNITIGPIDASYIGKTICLDSSYFPPSGIWLWVKEPTISARPTWSGPHCYMIGE